MPSSPISQYQDGQSDLELAPTDITVLLTPFYGTSPITNLEATGGGINSSLLANYVSVGNVTKRDGFKLTNNPTINNIMSTGKGSPTQIVASESVKSINYVPQQFSMQNISIYWGAVNSQFSNISATGGSTYGIPELPANLLYRAVLLGVSIAGDGNPVFFYWLANKVIPGKRSDMSLVDSNVMEHPVELVFLTDNTVGLPLIGGVCGQGWQTITANNTTGFAPAITGISFVNTTAAVTVAAGAGHTKQLQVVDSNGFDQTDEATYVSGTPANVTVSSKGVVTGVAAGTSVITATFDGDTATCTVTAS
jgi:hypothetical protein